MCCVVEKNIIFIEWKREMNFEHLNKDQLIDFFAK